MTNLFKYVYFMNYFFMNINYKYLYNRNQVRLRTILLIISRFYYFLLYIIHKVIECMLHHTQT